MPRLEDELEKMAAEPVEPGLDEAPAEPDVDPVDGEITMAVETALAGTAPEATREEKIDAAIAALEALKEPAAEEPRLGGLGGGEMPIGEEIL